MTQEELRACQLEQLKALKYIDKICKENGLTYYVHTGTLLGAIRHKGYIPWDMDTDLLMPKEDCQKLLHLIEVDNREYSVIRAADSSLGTDRVTLDHVRCYDPEVRGGDRRVHIDITAYAYARSYPKMLKGILNQFARLMRNLVAYRKGLTALNTNKRGYRTKKVALKVADILLSRMSDQDIRNFILHMATVEYDTGFVTAYNSFYGFGKETYPKSVFEKGEFCCFEDMTVPIPRGYKAILERLYGDWQTPPEANKRFPDRFGRMVLEMEKVEE